MNRLLDPNSFFNIVLIMGGILIFLGVVETPFVVPFPRATGIRVNISHQNKKKLFRIGLIMIILSVVMMSLTNWAGVFSPLPRKTSSQIDNPLQPRIASTDFWVAQAFAQGVPQGTYVRMLTIPQRHVKVFPTDSGAQIGIYIGDVHLVKSSRYLVFKVQSNWSDPGRIEADDLKMRLAPGSTLSEGRVANGGTISFELGSEHYDGIVHLKWYPFGEDFADVDIYKR